MAFVFEWPRFSPDFYASAARELTAALNTGEKPPNIASDIVVTELDLGTVAPLLDILELVELTADKFRGIFRLTYAGDAYITLQTSVQANPIVDGQSLSVGGALAGTMGMPAMVAANAPLIVPLQLKIANLKLLGIASLVVDRHRGITLAFKNDPLDSVQVNSTFDHMATIRRFLQSEIEKLLKKLFKEDLPALVHSASLRFFDSQRASARHPHPPSQPTDATASPDHDHVRRASAPAGWLSRSGQVMTEEPLELERDELVRLARAIHEPPSLRAPSAGTGLSRFFTRRASSTSVTAAGAAAAKAPRTGLAKAIDSDSDSERSGTPRKTAARSRQASTDVAPPSDDGSNAGPLPPTTPPPPVPPSVPAPQPPVDPRLDPGSLLGALGLLWPGNLLDPPASPTSESPTTRRGPARVHRFNSKYYERHKRPASSLYSSPSVVSLSSTYSLPAALPSHFRSGSASHQTHLPPPPMSVAGGGAGGHAPPHGLMRSHSHSFGSGNAFSDFSGPPSYNGTPLVSPTGLPPDSSRNGGGLPRARSSSSTGLRRANSSTTAGSGGASTGSGHSFAGPPTPTRSNGGGMARRNQGNTSGSLDPSDNYIAAQLANLYSANQSLSPFSRPHEHSTFRSIPKTLRKNGSGTLGAESAPVSPHPFGGGDAGFASASSHHGHGHGAGGSDFSVPTLSRANSATGVGGSGPASTVDARYLASRAGRRGRRAVRKRVFVVDLRPPPPPPPPEAEPETESGASSVYDAHSDDEWGSDAYDGGDERGHGMLLPSSSVSQAGGSPRTSPLVRPAAPPSFAF
ncbi:ERMES complex subunit [Blastocladiella emersonii ATCC 22665]|nr:ERMES complex subunit [Blastocladiella emersonii ATCC 22665]